MSGGFTIPLDRLAAMTTEKMETVARRATLEVFSSVVKKSPVDTGRFKANWNVSASNPDYSVTSSVAQSRGEQQAREALVLPVGGVVYLSNGLPYARRLEYGWSKQAPSGMVRTSVIEFKAFIDAAVRSA